MNRIYEYAPKSFFQVFTAWVDLPDGLFCDFVSIRCVQSLREKYFAFAVGQIIGLNPRVSRRMRGDRDRHERAVRCDGRGGHD